jgi:hypothetical protein
MVVSLVAADKSASSAGAKCGYLAIVERLWKFIPAKDQVDSKILGDVLRVSGEPASVAYDSKLNELESQAKLDRIIAAWPKLSTRMRRAFAVRTMMEEVRANKKLPARKSK